MEQRANLRKWLLYDVMNIFMILPLVNGKFEAIVINEKKIETRCYAHLESHWIQMEDEGCAKEEEKKDAKHLIWHSF